MGCECIRGNVAGREGGKGLEGELEGKVDGVENEWGGLHILQGGSEGKRMDRAVRRKHGWGRRISGVGCECI